MDGKLGFSDSETYLGMLLGGSHKPWIGCAATQGNSKKDFFRGTRDV